MKIGGIDVLDSVAADLGRCADANRIGSTYLCGGPGASRRVSLGPYFRIFAFSSVTIPPGIISLRGGRNESILSRVSTISTTTGKSRDIRKRLAEWTLVECPNPKGPRKAVAPARCISLALSMIAWYRGRLRHLSSSPRKARTRTASEGSRIVDPLSNSGFEQTPPRIASGGYDLCGAAP